jgi:hypothetical protein
MTTFAEELRNRLKTKQREWERCKEEVRKAKDKEAELRQEISALNVLLQREEPQDTRPATAIDVGDGNKAEIVRNLIEETAGREGLSPIQVRTLLESRGVAMPANYLYAVLMRAKRAGRIIEKNGRYFSPEEAKAAS